MKKKLWDYISIPSLALVGLLTMTGCATPGLGSGDYARAQARGEQTIRLGVVESIRKVRLEGTETGVGTIAGAGLGGLAGSRIGQGSGSVAAAIGGAVLGGIAGHAIEQTTTKQEGLEITIMLDNGKMIAVTQAADEPFRIGDRVRVLSDHRGVTRVAH
ncbi:Outer membrane lipoprotein pcp [Gammaproteobacteria bacterium]